MSKNGAKSHAFIAFGVIIVLVIIGLLAPYFAYEPDNRDLASANYIFPLIPYGPNTMDVENQNFVPPLAKSDPENWHYRHWLGTDQLGRDIASQMIHGTRTSMFIGFLSMLLALIPGVSLGLFSGYFGNKTLKMHWTTLLFGIFSGFTFLFYVFFPLNHHCYYYCLLFVGLLVFWWLLSQIDNILRNKSSKVIHFPLDNVLLRVIEIRKSLPGLFILFGVMTLFSGGSILNISLIIAILSFTEFARYTRGEVINVKSENYVVSAKVLGYSHLRILYRHILPNILPTIIVITCFSFSGAILLESSLSFLGYGLPVETASYGKILAGGRQVLAWWMVVFPGIAIFVWVFCLNYIASYFQERNK